MTAAAGLTERLVTVAGLRTRTLEAGSHGPAIVFLHALDFARGGLCHSALAWELNLPALGEEFRAIAFDAPGHGRADLPKEPESYAFEAQVRRLRGVLETLGVQRAHLVGHDQGAMTAVRLAFEAPELVASCTVVDSPSVAPAGDADANLTLAAPLRPLYSRRGQRWILSRLSYTPHHAGTGRFLDEAVETAASAAFTEATRQMTAADAASRFRRSLARLRTDTFVRMRDRGLPVPTLLVWGNQDPISPPAFAQSTFALIAARQPVTQLRLINRAGYLPFREQPDIFNAVVRGFVRTVEHLTGTRATTT